MHGEPIPVRPRAEVRGRVTVTARPLPEVGQMVHVRSRRWLVDGFTELGDGTPPLVRLACADDDAQGQVVAI